MKGFNLLIVEDEKNLGETLRDYLRSKNFQVEWAASVQEAEAWRKNSHTLISS
jgi:DNA-binding response OmpR family regulator